MSADPKELRRLYDKAQSAMFDLHRYMELHGDSWWSKVYRLRCDLGALMDGRIKVAERKPSCYMCCGMAAATLGDQHDPICKAKRKP